MLQICFPLMINLNMEKASLVRCTRQFPSVVACIEQLMEQVGVKTNLLLVCFSPPPTVAASVHLFSLSSFHPSPAPCVTSLFYSWESHMAAIDFTTISDPVGL